MVKSFNIIKSIASGLALVFGGCSSGSTDLSSLLSDGSSIVVSASSVVADGSSSVSVTVTLRDSGGQAVKSKKVVLSSSRGAVDAISPSSAETDSDGKAAFVVTSLTAGAATLTAQDEEGSFSLELEDGLTFVAGAASAAHTTLSLSASNVPADGSSQVQIAVSLKDANGNAISGESVSLSSSRGGSDSISPSSSTTDSSGLAAFAVSSAVTGIATLSAQDASGSAVATGTLTFSAVTRNLEVPIEMLSDGIGSRSLADFTHIRSITSLDPSEYDGTVTYFFEVVATNADSVSRAITLVDSSGNAEAAVAVPAGSAAPTRYRVALGAAPTSADTYKVKLEGTNTDVDLAVTSARILVKQAGATKTRLYIPLVTNQHASVWNLEVGTNGTASIDSTGSVHPTLAQTSTRLDRYSHWVRNDSAFSEIPSSGTPWTLEALVRNDSGTGYAVLYNVTDGAAAATVSVSVTGGTPQLVSTSFAGSASGFGDSKRYTVKIATSDASYTTTLYKAGIWLRLANLRKAEVYHRVMGSNVSGVTIGENQRVLLDLSAYSSPSVYFESGGEYASGSNTVNLRECAGDSGAACSAISGATHAYDSATDVPTRSGPHAVTSGNQFIVEPIWTGGSGINVKVRQCFVVVKFE